MNQRFEYQTAVVRGTWPGIGFVFVEILTRVGIKSWILEMKSWERKQ